jgi:membrane protease YdiL (CAAX protease family)
MQQKITVSERVLLAAAVVVAAAWSLLVLTISLGFQGTSAISTWAIRILLLAAGGVITAAVIYGLYRSWHRATSMPLPGGRASRWLAHQPGWRLAIGCWLVYSAPEVGTSLWLSHGDWDAPTAPHVGYLVTSVIAASLLALMFRTVWQRQLANTMLPDTGAQRA